MGLSVDNGSNWWDLCLDDGEWLNVGMPVGPRNHRRLLDDLYRGSQQTAVYLYHPNLWKIAKGFLDAERLDRDIFSHLRWLTGFLATTALYPKWVVRELGKVETGLSIYAKWNGKPFHFNPLYNYLPISKNEDLAEIVLRDLEEIFARFRKVIVVRVPIKEEVVEEPAVEERLRDLRGNYDEWWQRFADQISAHAELVHLEPSPFGSADFHPVDTHWTTKGNQKFAGLLSSVLLNGAVSGVQSVH